MLTVDEDKRPASIQAVRDALLGRCDLPRDANEALQASVQVASTNSGQITLIFEQPIDADVLEVAFFVMPPGSYLHPSTGHGSSAARLMRSPSPKM